MSGEAVVAEADIEALFQIVFGRAVGHDDYKRELVARGIRDGELMRVLLASAE